MYTPSLRIAQILRHVLVKCRVDLAQDSEIRSALTSIGFFKLAINLNVKHLKLQCRAFAKSIKGGGM